MRYRYHGQEKIRKPLRDLVEQKAQLLDRRLQTVEEDLKMLDIRVDQHARTGIYTTRLRLRVLSRDLPATHQAKTVLESARGAFDDLFDQLEEFMAKLRREPEIRSEQRKPAWLPEPSLPVDGEQ